MIMSRIILTYFFLGLQLLSRGQVHLDTEEQILEVEISSEYTEADPDFRDRYGSEEFKYSTEEDKDPELKLPEGSMNFTGLGKVILNIILILAIGFILFLLLNSLKDFRFKSRSPKNKKPEAEQHETETRGFEVLTEKDLRALLEKAKADGDYRLSIRYYFLLYLESLQRLRKLSYNMDKTNHDYLLELKDTDDRELFIKLAYIFEYVWYGQKGIDVTSFYKLERYFKEELR
jgi:large-conductance mechanosensitive channel